MIYTAYLGLGGNLGNVLETFQHVLHMLSEASIQVETCSKAYQNPAMIADGTLSSHEPPYYNAVCRVSTHLSPFALMQTLLTLEQKLGRKRTERYASRIIDLDLLYVAKVHCQTLQLQLPHPALTQREFVLAPLSEIEPELILQTSEYTKGTTTQLLWHLRQLHGSVITHIVAWH